MGGETVPDIESGTVVQQCMCRSLPKHPALLQASLLRKTRVGSLGGTVFVPPKHSVGNWSPVFGNVWTEKPWHQKWRGEEGRRALTRGQL
jgi:hypothetical protein